MLFHLFRKIKPNIQDEYIDLVAIIMRSPLWDGSDKQIFDSLPSDLSADTIAYVRKKLDNLS